MSLYLCRHGQTEWTQSGQHTGLTDIPLTAVGKLQAAKMATPLQKISFRKILSSPKLRALQTTTLAGFQPELDPDLVEWNYGDYEGLTTPEIQTINPGWIVFKDGAPNGESVEDVTARADRVLKKIHSIPGPVAIFSHAHFSRALAARFLGLPVSAGMLFFLNPASISILGLEHDRPVIHLWNETIHLEL